MLIDWFTVGAQALNFIILVWLLKRFLYKPILTAIDAREERIAAELADADSKKSEAQKEREKFLQKNAQFDQQRASMMGKATDEVKAERQKLLDEAHNAANDLSAKRQETLRNNAENLNQEIRRRTQQEVFAVARKALTDMAATDLEQRMAEVLEHRLGTMDADQKEMLVKAFAAANEPMIVRSAFELPTAQRATIQTAINNVLSSDITVQFETDPGLISGIELTVNGQKIAWSIEGYLGSLEKDVNELLNGTDVSVPKVKHDAKSNPKGKQ